MLLTARRRGAAGQTNSSNSACGLAVDAGALCASEQNCMFDCQARKLYVWSEAAATRDDARLACGALNFWQLAGAGANISAPSGLATLVCYGSYLEQLAVERWFLSRRASSDPPSYWLGLRVSGDW
jgi:hypothetical protein